MEIDKGYFFTPKKLTQKIYILKKFDEISQTISMLLYIRYLGGVDIVNCISYFHYNKQNKISKTRSCGYPNTKRHLCTFTYCFSLQS